MAVLYVLTINKVEVHDPFQKRKNAFSLEYVVDLKVHPIDQCSGLLR